MSSQNASRSSPASSYGSTTCRLFTTQTYPRVAARSSEQIQVVARSRSTPSGSPRRQIGQPLPSTSERQRSGSSQIEPPSSPFGPSLQIPIPSGMHLLSLGPSKPGYARQP